MTIREAIEKAIEGGWDKTRALFNPNNASYSMEKVYLDPEFWQALGKSIGWRLDKTQFSEGRQGHTRTYLMSGWQYRWHNFIDHLSDGGTIEEYFDKL